MSPVLKAAVLICQKHSAEIYEGARNWHDAGTRSGIPFDFIMARSLQSTAATIATHAREFLENGDVDGSAALQLAMRGGKP